MRLYQRYPDLDLDLDGAVAELQLKTVHILRDEELVVGEVFLGGERVAGVGVHELHLFCLVPQGDRAQGVAALVKQT